MASPSSTASARRARAARARAGTPRWEGAAAAFDGRSRSGQPSRRRRLVLRTGPIVVAFALLPMIIGWVRDSGPMTPAEVSAKAHDQVLREVITRTGDYSTTIGPLDCTEIEPGKGNCLADLRSAAHRADGLMVAAAYDVESGGSNMHLVVKLP